jgi:uncharacterized RDD family membrane protein YckC
MNDFTGLSLSDSLVLPSSGASLDPQPDYIGFWPRCVARLVDTILHNIVVAAAILVASAIAGIVATAHGRDIGLLLARTQKSSLPAMLMALLGQFVYHSISEGLHGSTVGKRLLGLVTLDEDTRPCSLRQGLGRSAAFFIDGLFFAIPAAVSISQSALRQRIGDRWLRTVVVRRTSVSPSLLRSGTRLFAVTFAAFAVDATFVAVSYFLWLLA